MSYTVYIPERGKTEDLVSALEEVFPGQVHARVVLEVKVPTKAIANFLRSLAEAEAGSEKKAPNKPAARNPGGRLPNKVKLSSPFQPAPPPAP